MSYTSPFTNPAQYVSEVNKLSSEGISVDAWFARVIREAADLSGKYSSDFPLTLEVKAALDAFNPRWTKPLLDSRDAASSVSAWLQRFDQVYLAMIADIASQQDARDVVTEFKALQAEEYPSMKYDLEAVPGPKSAFEEIEGLVTQDSTNIISVLEDSDWQKGVEELKKTLALVQNGVRQVRTALNNYAVKVEARED
ncbi:hypothetical protein MD484_g6476, partial [Candolleomyces efflorescens]